MPVTYLTREGYDKLQEELEYLRTVKRREVAERLHEAMEGGELIEDAEYEAAKNEQAFVEGRIHELETILANARVIDPSLSRSEIVQVGAKVTIQEGSNEPETYTIVGPAEANPRLGRISNESPLGRALIDHRVGDEVRVDAPDGPFTVKILKVE
ncbi:MAG: Transcription elongation factor GreA [Anaerolineae bacterium]|jgi:transcription elongation factor GreA|nr:MAG: Transcription elongation factor GreA [Anaerolineae bacterium]